MLSALMITCEPNRALFKIRRCVCEVKVMCLRARARWLRGAYLIRTNSRCCHGSVALCMWIADHVLVDTVGELAPAASGSRSEQCTVDMAWTLRCEASRTMSQNAHWNATA